MAGLGARPSRCAAVIGPAVCGRCYEVPERLRDEVCARLPQAWQTTRRGTASLDLVAGVESVLRDADVGSVRRLDCCTVEDERFFSYRRHGTTGRFAGVIGRPRESGPGCASDAERVTP
jgi:hypothetical protein